ncbi:SRPBCC domain-containing protein [Blastococcus sp. CT_GayMR16]|uniref:SRPBCC domain-containing protein n=1 Tax=Blastococcus sp. CT_GayMR16 TaxID=2559607 RepID=UPI0010748BB4|nr:SRPBCC domain-containing protein [Blastococcus sp. CT_GayMR16]TFV91246.1 SRPBCC domain-containing protein [Blastococcus sp. CT_GayMR16]
MIGEHRTSIDIDATPELVWEVLTDLPAYPEWCPLVTGAEGTFALGGRVSFTFPPMGALLRTTVRATVLEVTQCRRLRYLLRFARRGVPGLLDVQHTVTIDLQDDGVRLWEEMRFRGLLLPLMTRSLNRDSGPAVGAMPAALKNRIEGRRATRIE